MDTTFHEIIARQRMADIERRVRRAQHPDTHTPTTPRRGMVFTFRFRTRRSRTIALG